MEENRAAVNIFMTALNHVRYAPSGKALGIDLNVVLGLLKMNNIDNSPETLEKVLLLSKEIIK